MGPNRYYETGVHVIITGKDIYDDLWMPEAPRKGDLLWLGSLTRGRFPINEVLVSTVEWSMDQTSGMISAWVKVRRTKNSVEYKREPTSD